MKSIPGATYVEEQNETKQRESSRSVQKPAAVTGGGPLESREPGMCFYSADLRDLSMLEEKVLHPLHCGTLLNGLSVSLY